MSKSTLTIVLIGLALAGLVTAVLILTRPKPVKQTNGWDFLSSAVGPAVGLLALA
jgi:hypothetical protein